MARSNVLMLGILAVVPLLSLAYSAAAASSLPEGYGLAARYPGDAGIAQDSAVVLFEGFEVADPSAARPAVAKPALGGPPSRPSGLGTAVAVRFPGLATSLRAGLGALRERWSDVKNEEGKALLLDSSVPAASAGSHSLRVTATRGANSGGYVFTVLKPGYDQLFLRFYVKFAADYGFDHHFCSLSGEYDPPPYPVGRAGIRPDNYWGTGIEPTTDSPQTYPAKEFAPPGIWHFYTYWPEMRSFEHEDGTGTQCYGNDFEPKKPVVVPRDRWICVEIMVKMNSAPEKSDGEQALWIDGRLVAHFAPGIPVGYWLRDVFRNNTERGTPFAGLRWRRDMRVNVNKVKLENYVSESAFARSEAYAKGHPDFLINTHESTVWFDHVVVSTQYVGPIKAR